MGRIRSITAVACTALLLGAASTTAQTSDRTTFVTFSGPVSIPGKTLPAGTYTFRLADSPADRHIVQIFDKEQSKILATLLAVPAERNQAEGEPVITFRETPADRPPALRYWYYAGEKSGNEFVYPKSQAMMIARASGEGVMAIETESTNVSDWTGTPTRVTATTEPQSATTASTATATSTASTASTTTAEPTTPPPATATGTTTGTATGTTGSTATGTTTGTMTGTATGTTATQPTTTSQPTTAERPATVPVTAAPDQPRPTTAPTTAPETVGTSGRTEPSELPRTASELPLVGLIALLAFAGAVALRVSRKAVV
jgi:hypothetical protein